MADFYDELKQSIPYAFEVTEESLGATIEGNWEEYHDEMNLKPLNVTKKIIGEIEGLIGKNHVDFVYKKLSELINQISEENQKAMEYLDEWKRNFLASKMKSIVVQGIGKSVKERAKVAKRLDHFESKQQVNKIDQRTV
ncbi:hypothetical protein [Paenibacillus albus]|uniref:Uncharacterized protein n=1 Tax=Paenibacillus albus TaxID=2495582 RepID=A0A3Q8X585_9BACL|nr:hypothetical protein [Paenibacillus albus]AZN40385.1 hypothetical protein EJC50_12550 [Paenibacillus albus]